MKNLIIILLFIPFISFAQRDSLITDDLGFVVDETDLEVSMGDSTVRVVYFTESADRKDEIRYYEKAPSAKATMASVYNELLNQLPLLSADVEAAYREYQKKNTALINTRRQFEAIEGIMIGYFGY